MAATCTPSPPVRFNDVPTHLRQRQFALIWPEVDTPQPLPNIVNLLIDAKGFYFICENKHTKTIECFDLALIHDTRNGSAVTLPPGARECPQMHTGSLGDTLASKWLTIYYGDSFVPSPELRTVHFCFNTAKQAKEWADRLFKFGHNQWLKNFSSLEGLEKVHSRIIHGLLDLDAQAIPVEKLISFLCDGFGEEAKRAKIYEALRRAHLPHTRGANIRPEQLTFDVFFSIYEQLMEREDISTLFNQLDGRAKGHLNVRNLRDFLQKQEDVVDTHLQGVNYEQKSKDLLAEHCQRMDNGKLEGIDRKSLLRYLMSFDNLIVDPTVFDLHMDMDEPLAHYCIASSHNTYLTGGQWVGQASNEIYRQVLLAGCRCIEIDVVDSDNKEPIVKHIYTPVRPIPFLRVITAIRDHAFKTSTFPVILSIENHCGEAAQAMMAKYLVDVFGDSLVTQPLESHPCRENYPLPSPRQLQKKILIKNKKIEAPSTIKKSNPKERSSITPSNSDPSNRAIAAAPSATPPPDRLSTRVQLVKEYPRHAVFYDDILSGESTERNRMELLERASNAPDPPPETRAIKAMSDLVVYFVPARFVNFGWARERARSYEISSLTEDQAFNLIRDEPRQFVAFNQRQCSRIYPRGRRINSTNFDPYIYWRVGCQMAALNYQTLDTEMQLNLGLFALNGACGYIKKPAALCEPNGTFDPQALASNEKLEACDIQLKILSGQFLCQSREPSSVNVQLHGSYNERTQRCRYHMRAKRWNGFQAVYDDTPTDLNNWPIHFSTIHLPEMAALRFEVLADNGTLIGQCFIPISHLRSGYRHVVLRNKINVPSGAASLFIYVKMLHTSGRAHSIVRPSQLPKTDHGVVACPEAVVVHRPRFRQGSSVDGEHEATDLSASTTTMEKPNWYEEHVLAGSRFRDKKDLCEVAIPREKERERIRQRDEAIAENLRGIADKYDKLIRKEEEHLEIQLISGQQQHRPSASANKKCGSALEQRLFELYKKKFDEQQTAERKHFDRYHSDARVAINQTTKEKVKQLEAIFDKEKRRAEEDARLSALPDGSSSKSATSTLRRFFPLVNRSPSADDDCGASTIRKLEAMYKETETILQTNSQARLRELDEQNRFKVEAYEEKYRRLLEEATARWLRRIYPAGQNPPSEQTPLTGRARAATGSSIFSDHLFPDGSPSNQQQRRPSMGQ